MNVSHKSRRRRAGLMALCMLATCGAMLPENSVQQTVSADSFGLYGDLDGNGMVNAMDLQLLKSYVLGNITSFPAGDASFGGCGGENSLMMAGSASKITDFDGWMLRYVWSKIKDESGRFS